MIGSPVRLPVARHGLLEITTHVCKHTHTHAASSSAHIRLYRYQGVWWCVHACVHGAFVWCRGRHPGDTCRRERLQCLRGLMLPWLRSGNERMRWVLVG